jgi:hypothetical protein
VDLAEKGGVGGLVEVVEEVGEEDEVVVGAPVGVEGAAGEGLVAVKDAGAAGVVLGDDQDVGPVVGDDGGSGVVAGDGDAEEAVA